MSNIAASPVVTADASTVVTADASPVWSEYLGASAKVLARTVDNSADMLFGKDNRLAKVGMLESLIGYFLINQIAKSGQPAKVDAFVAKYSACKGGKLKALDALRTARVKLVNMGVHAPESDKLECAQVCYADMVAHMIDAGVIRQAAKLAAVMTEKNVSEEEAKKLIEEAKKAKAENTFNEKAKEAGFIHESQVKTFNELESARIQDLLKQLDDMREENQRTVEVQKALRAQLADSKQAFNALQEKHSALLSKIDAMQQVSKVKAVQAALLTLAA